VANPEHVEIFAVLNGANLSRADLSYANLHAADRQGGFRRV
jgi:uncharacterized protein YjbI with pentapeptide repeats